MSSEDYPDTPSGSSEEDSWAAVEELSDGYTSPSDSDCSSDESGSDDQEHEFRAYLEFANKYLF